MFLCVPSSSLNFPMDANFFTQNSVFGHWILTSDLWPAFQRLLPGCDLLSSFFSHSVIQKGLTLIIFANKSTFSHRCTALSLNLQWVFMVVVFFYEKRLNWSGEGQRGFLLAQDFWPSVQLKVFWRSGIPRGSWDELENTNITLYTLPWKTEEVLHVETDGVGFRLMHLPQVMEELGVCSSPANSQSIKWGWTQDERSSPLVPFFCWSSASSCSFSVIIWRAAFF